MAGCLQGAFVAPADATIRLQVTPGGVGDWVVSAGDYWPSVDAMLAELLTVNPVSTSIWNASLVPSTTQYTAGVQVVSTRSWTIEWSRAGDGTAIRDWLGATGNLSLTAGTYRFPNAHTAGWYPPYDLTAVRRDTHRRHRSHILLANGTTQAQHNTSPSDATSASVTLSLQFDDGTGDYQGHSQLEQFIDDIHTATGSVPVFSAFWGPDGAEKSEVLRLTGEVLDVMPRQVPSSSPGELWRVDLKCEVSA